MDGCPGARSRRWRRHRDNPRQHSRGTSTGSYLLEGRFTVYRNLVCFGVSIPIAFLTVCTLQLEKMIIWRHCQDADCEIHGSAAPLVLIGEAFHDFVGGVVITAYGRLILPAVWLDVVT